VGALGGSTYVPPSAGSREDEYLGQVVSKADVALSVDGSIMVAVCGPAPALRVYFHRLTVHKDAHYEKLVRENLTPHYIVPGALSASLADLPSITAIAFDPASSGRALVVATGTLKQTSPCLIERWAIDQRGANGQPAPVG